MSINYRLILICLLLTSISITTIAQTQIKPYTSEDIFKTKYFIENKGQFDSYAKHIPNIDFALHHKNDEIYMNNLGVQFHLLEQRIVDKENEEGDKRKMLELVKDDWFALEWIDGNKNAHFNTQNKSEHYFSYGSKEYISYGYKSITYNDVYPGIDIEYKVHEKGGIEYILYVSAHADLSLVKLKYSAQGAITTTINKNKISIENSTGKLVESGIKAFYKNGDPIEIVYREQGHIISFKPLHKIDKSRAFIIDPWITASTALTGTTPNTHGYDVDYDLQGNLLVMGGGGGTNSTTDAPKIAKYDQTGVLVWVFSGNIVTPIWNSAPQWGTPGYIGNFIVDKSNSKIYMSQGGVPNGATVVRLNSSGIYDNFLSLADPLMQEIWEMKFNCNSGDLIACGGGTSSNLNFGIIDSSTGTVTTSNITGLGGGLQDIACATLDANGELYVIFASNSNTFVNNRIYKLDAGYTVALWDTPSTYQTLTEIGNRPSSGITHYGNGINCLSVNDTYLFYYDGKNLKAFDKNTGGAVGAPYDNGLAAKYQYGIYANNCNEVYVGMHNGSIHKMLFNGSNFVLQDSIVITNYPTNSVFDIVYNPLTNQLMVSGDGFAASTNTQSNCTISSTGNINLSYTIYCPDSATVSVTNGSPGDSYTFTWLDSNTNTTLSNTSTGAGVFTHGVGGLPVGHTIDITVSKSSACQYFSNDTSFNMVCLLDTVIYRITCPGDTIHIGTNIISVPGVYIDTFLNISNQDSIVGTYYSHYPTYNQTVTASICQGGTYQLPDNVIVTTSGTYTSTLTTIDGCDSVINTILTINAPVPTNILATICSTDFYTLPDNSTTSTQGIYLDTIQAIDGCDSVIRTDLRVIEQSNFSLGNDFIICGGNTVTLDATIAGASSYSWQDFSNQPTFTIQQEGTYYVTVNIPPCNPVSDTVVVTACNCRIYIPNAFSPNGDQNNDQFKPFIECNLPIENYEFRIFNRWGQLIFITNDISEAWDGTFKDEAQPIGSYFYTVNYLNPETQEPDLRKGDITLIR